MAKKTFFPPSREIQNNDCERSIKKMTYKKAEEEEEEEWRTVKLGSMIQKVNNFIYVKEAFFQ